VKRTLIIDFHFIGHHLHYIRLYAEALLDNGCQVTVAIPKEALQTNEFKVHLEKLRDKITLIPFKDCPNKNLKKLFLIRSITKQTKSNHVYLPIMDGFLQTATMVMYKQWPGVRDVPHEGCLFTGSYATKTKHNLLYRFKQSINEWLVVHTQFERVYFLNLAVYEYLKKKNYPMLKRAVAMPEPLEPVSPCNREELCAELNLDPNCKYILSLGVQSLRKGTHLLINAFCKANLPENSRLLIVGSIMDEVKTIISAPDIDANPNIIKIDRYISDKEFFEYLDVADVIALPYLKHLGSSGIANRAIIRNKILVGNSFGYMGSLVEQYYRGIIHSDEIGSLKEALEKSFGDIPEEADNIFVKDFSLFHTEEQFKKTIIGDTSVY